MDPISRSHPNKALTLRMGIFQRVFAAVHLLGITITFGDSKPATLPPRVQYQVIKNLYRQGSDPTGLIQGRDGYLYGTLQHGGREWAGVVFRVKPDGSNYSSVYEFGKKSGHEETLWPQGVIEGADGFLYGTTLLGGAPAGDEFPTGCGLVFKVNKDGSGYQVQHRFSLSPDNGAAPFAGVVENSTGVLFGTTQRGGARGAGVVFRLNRDGTGFAILHHFMENEKDGIGPMAGLLCGSDGVLYGTTAHGGNSDLLNGTVFRINPDGTGYRVLHGFPNLIGHGKAPRVALVEGTDQMLYGTTHDGGRLEGGTVFRMSKDGSGFQVLKEFNGSPESKPDPTGKIEGMVNGVAVMSALDGDGGAPMSLAFGRDGLLYGFTELWGKHSGGTLFRVQKDGRGFETLHHFLGVDRDGKDPAGTLVSGSDGALYGLTIRSETNDFSSLDRIAPVPIPPAITPKK